MQWWMHRACPRARLFLASLACHKCAPAVLNFFVLKSMRFRHICAVCVRCMGKEDLRDYFGDEEEVHAHLPARLRYYGA